MFYYNNDTQKATQHGYQIKYIHFNDIKRHVIKQLLF